MIFCSKLRIGRFECEGLGAVFAHNRLMVRCILYHLHPLVGAAETMESRYVRLESGSGKPKKKAAGAVEHTLKLAIRLNEAINDALRGLIRYRGDLSGMAMSI